jgi:hypothetical protein
MDYSRKSNSLDETMIRVKTTRASAKNAPKDPNAPKRPQKAAPSEPANPSTETARFLCSTPSVTKIRRYPCYQTITEVKQSPAQSSTGKLRESLSRLVQFWAEELVTSLARPKGILNVGYLTSIWTSGESQRGVKSLENSVKEWADKTRNTSIFDKVTRRWIEDTTENGGYMGKIVDKWCAVNDWNPKGCSERKRLQHLLELWAEVMARVHRMLASPSAYLMSKRFQAFYARLQKQKSTLGLVTIEPPKTFPESDPLDVFDAVADDFCSYGAPMGKTLSARFRSSASCTGGMESAIYLIFAAAYNIQSIPTTNANTASTNRENKAYQLWEDLGVSDAMLCFLARMSENSYSSTDFPTCFAAANLSPSAKDKEKAKEEKAKEKAKEEKQKAKAASKGGSGEEEMQYQSWRDVWNASRR